MLDLLKELNNVKICNLKYDKNHKVYKNIDLINLFSDN